MKVRVTWSIPLLGLGTPTVAGIGPPSGVLQGGSTMPSFVAGTFGRRKLSCQQFPVPKPSHPKSIRFAPPARLGGAYILFVMNRLPLLRNGNAIGSLVGPINAP